MVHHGLGVTIEDRRDYNGVTVVVDGGSRSCDWRVRHHAGGRGSKATSRVWSRR